jgi:hypothetical protein
MFLRHTPSGVLFYCRFTTQGRSQSPVLVRGVEESAIPPDQVMAYEVYSCSPQDETRLAWYRGLRVPVPCPTG